MSAQLHLIKSIDRMPSSLRSLATLALVSALDGYTGLETRRKSYLWNDGVRDTIVDAWVTYSTPRRDGDCELSRPSTESFDCVLNDLIAANDSLRDGQDGVFVIPTTIGVSNASLSIDLVNLSIRLTHDASLTEQVAKDTLSAFVNCTIDNPSPDQRM